MFLAHFVTLYPAKINVSTVNFRSRTLSPTASVIGAKCVMHKFPRTSTPTLVRVLVGSNLGRTQSWPGICLCKAAKHAHHRGPQAGRLCVIIVVQYAYSVGYIVLLFNQTAPAVATRKQQIMGVSRLRSFGTLFRFRFANLVLSPRFVRHAVDFVVCVAD